MLAALKPTPISAVALTSQQRLSSCGRCRVGRLLSPATFLRCPPSPDQPMGAGNLCWQPMVCKNLYFLMCLPFPIGFVVNGSNSPQPKSSSFHLHIESISQVPTLFLPARLFFSGPIHAFPLFWQELEHISFQNGCSSMFESPYQNRCGCNSMLERFIFTNRRFYLSN